MGPMSPAHVVTSALEWRCHCSGWFSPEFYQGKAKSLFLKPGNSSLMFIPADLGHSGKQHGAGSWSPGCSLLSWSLWSSTAPLTSGGSSVYLHGIAQGWQRALKSQKLSFDPSSEGNTWK